MCHAVASYMLLLCVFHGICAEGKLLRLCVCGCM